MTNDVVETTVDRDGHTTVVTAFQPLTALDTDTLTSRFSGDPGGWLPDPATPVSVGWVTRLHAGPVSHSALCMVGEPWVQAGQLWRRVSWQPADTHGRARTHHGALPDFEGDLGLLTTSGPTLALTGTYEPPGGTIGAAADRLLLERVAMATVRRWLADAARRIVVPRE